jgi:hypothetical protein
MALKVPRWKTAAIRLTPAAGHGELKSAGKHFNRGNELQLDFAWAGYLK